MSNVSQFYSKTDIKEQACLWISRLDRGLSKGEKQDLVAWINQNKQHHSQLLEMASYWDDLSVLNELSGLFPLEKNPKKKPNKLTNLAMAASFAFVSLLTANFFFTDSLNPFAVQQQIVQQQTFQTKMGEQANFSMPDGSTIQLNTNSIVQIAFTLNQRKLTLVRGEAQFDVAKDKNRPFTVVAGEKSFTALGTIFNVQKNNEQTLELVVTEGRVLIAKANETLTNISKSFTHIAEDMLPGTLVVAGEKALIIDGMTSSAQEISLDQVQRDLAWQQGMLIFQGEPLSQALIEVSRYTNTIFEISDPELSNIKVAGYFKAGDIDGLLASLQTNFNIVASEQINNSIKLTVLAD